MSGQQVVTELVIDANTAGADQFSSAMDKSTESTTSAMGAAASMGLAIAGVGIAVVGVLGGLRSFIDYVGQQSQVLVDMTEHAAIAGISVREFQQTLFAARSNGISDKDFVSGLDKISADLQQAGRGVTEFSKLFDANGIAIRNQNGQLITTKQALGDIMGLMQNAAPDMQQRLAAIVGVSQSWIPFLREGETQLEAQKQAAETLGVVIEQATIDKAAEFNTQWKTAVATWDLQFKASLSSILPLLTQAATLASTIISGIGSLSGTIGRWLTPIDDQNKSQLNDTINEVYRLRDAVEALGGSLDKNSKYSKSGFQASILAGSLGLSENASLGEVDQLLDKLQRRFDNAPSRLEVTPSFSTKLPATGEAASDIETTTNAIEKQIAKMQADAEAAGQGAGALEQLRVEAQLYAAAERAGITGTEKFADQFYQLSDRAGAAATALAKAKVAADIKFGSNTAFLSSSDVAIAQKLKDIYPDVTTALNSAQAAQLRFNDAIRSTSSAIENDLVGGLTDIATRTKSVGQGFSDMAATVLKSIEQMIIKIAIVQPLMQALQASVTSSGILGFLGIGGGGLPGTAGSSLFGPLAPSAHGNLFNAGNIIPFAQGGVIDSPSIAPMALFGEAGPEAIVPLRRGADGNLGIASQGSGSQMAFTYAPTIDARGADAQAVARLAQVVANDKKNFEKSVQAVVTRTRLNNPGAWR